MSFKINLFFLAIFLLMVSCAWEKENPAALYDLFFLERNGAQMPVHIHGNSDSKVFVIILHGGPGGNGLEYRPGVLSEEIEHKYAVVYFDQRGQGMSQGHLNTENTSIAEMVEDVHALNHAIKFKYGNDASLFLLGHSWGGTLGTAYLSTKDYQYDFNGWIEVDGAHDFGLMIRAQKRLILEIGHTQIQEEREIDFWTSYIEIADKVDSVTFTQNDVSELNGKAFEAEAKLLEAGVIRNGTDDYLNYGTLFKSYVLSTNPLTSSFTGSLTNQSLVENDGLFSAAFDLKLEKIEIPSLLLWGKYDLVIPAELGHQAMAEISSEHKKLIIYEHSGHDPMATEGITFAADLIEFIEEFK